MDLIFLHYKDTLVIAKIPIIAYLEIRCRERRRVEGTLSCSVSYSFRLHSLENKWIAGCSSVQKYGQSAHCVGAALHVKSFSAFTCG